MSLEKKGMSRRKFLGGAVATLGVGAMVALTPDKEERDAIKHAEEVKKMREKAAEPRIATFLNPERRPQIYETFGLHGKTFGPPLNAMLGLYGKTGEVAEIDFKYQLALLYQKKLEIMQGDDDDGDFDVHNPGVLEALQSKYESYKGADKMVFEQYRQHIGTIVSHLRPHMPWQRIENSFKLGAHQTRLLHRFEKQIDADLLVAYSMTELMPSENGTVNAKIMDFLLQNAGRDYIERLPALGDREFSFGPYQFTGAAMYAGISPGPTAVFEKRGAAVIDQLFQKPVLPPNVASLSGDQHYQAAYLFAIYNLLLLVKDIGEERSSRLGKHIESISSSIGDYVSAAHNSPREARSEFVRYVRETIGEKTLMRGNTPSYGQILRPQLQTYVRKTQNNRSALSAHAKARSL
jgi:hypothetical protein